MLPDQNSTIQSFTEIFTKVIEEETSDYRLSTEASAYFKQESNKIVARQNKSWQDNNSKFKWHLLRLTLLLHQLELATASVLGTTRQDVSLIQ